MIIVLSAFMLAQYFELDHILELCFACCQYLGGIQAGKADDKSASEAATWQLPRQGLASDPRT